MPARGGPRLPWFGLLQPPSSCRRRCLAGQAFTGAGFSALQEINVRIQQAQPAASPNESQPYSEVWRRNGSAELLFSSKGRGWSGLPAESWAHGKSLVPWEGAQSELRVCANIRGNGAVVTRRAPGIEDRTVTGRNTVWVSPPDWQGDSIEFADDLPEIVHIYLPTSQFSPGKLGLNIDGRAIGSLRCESAFEDPLLGEIGRAIASELQAETSAGRLLVESLANSIARRLAQQHIGAPICKSEEFPAKGALDRRRLSRVLDYIETNLEGDLSLDSMASIACLSRYHFARAFKKAVGQSPHRHVSARRLERAKALLVEGDRPLVDIAAFPTRRTSHAHSGRRRVWRPANFVRSADRADATRRWLKSGSHFRFWRDSWLRRRQQKFEKLVLRPNHFDKPTDR